MPQLSTNQYEAAATAYDNATGGHDTRLRAAVTAALNTNPPLPDDAVAQRLAGASAHPRYAGDGWRRLVNQDDLAATFAAINHAYKQAVRRGTPGQIDQLRAWRDQLLDPRHDRDGARA